MCHKNLLLFYLLSNWWLSLKVYFQRLFAHFEIGIQKGYKNLDKYSHEYIKNVKEILFDFKIDIYFYVLMFYGLEIKSCM